MDPQPEVTWMVLGLLSLPCALLTIFAVPRWKSQASASWKTAQRLSLDFPKARTDDERQALARSYGTQILGSSVGLFVSSSALLIAFILPWIAVSASNLQRAAWLTVLSASFLAGWFKRHSSPDFNS
jgi:hypothetical protein